MEWTEIGGLITVIGGALAGLIGGFRTLKSDRFRQKQEEGATLLSHYETLVSDLRGEVIAVRKECRQEIAALKEEHRKEQEEWAMEKAELRAEIAILTARLSKLEGGPPKNAGLLD